MMTSGTGQVPEPVPVPTDEQRTLIEAIKSALSRDNRIESAWLSGSFGRGAADEWSDIDVMVVVAKDALAETFKGYAADLTAISKVVFTNTIAGRVVNAITPDWQRFDLAFGTPDELALARADQLKILFNRGSKTPQHRESGREAAPPSSDPVLTLTREFLRVLGLAPVVIGRGEYLVGLDGISILRRLTADLMLEENGLPPLGTRGALHLNSLLSDEQRQTLEKLPPIYATRESVVAVNEALARIFLPIAKRLMAQRGGAWPAEFEEAARRHLLMRAGIRI